jgi:hypothetical protein
VAWQLLSHCRRGVGFEEAIVKALDPQTLEDIADRWTVLLTQLDRHPGRYPEQFYVEIASLIAQARRVIDPDPFEHEVLQIASLLAHEGSLKMALFRLHEIIEARLTRPRYASQSQQRRRP